MQATAWLHCPGKRPEKAILEDYNFVMPDEVKITILFQANWAVDNPLEKEFVYLEIRIKISMN
jgi:hypothetical protein